MNPETKQFIEDVYYEHRMIEEPNVEKQQLAIDPAMLLLIGKLIIAMIKCFNKHGLNSEKVARSDYRVSWITRQRLKWIMVKKLGLRKYKKHGHSISKALFRRSQYLTKQQIETILERKK